MGAFTAQKIAILGQNPNVLSVTEKRLTLTKEFRMQFWSDYNSGKQPGIIFKEYAGRPAGKHRCIAYREKVTKTEDTSDELKQLRNEVNYLRQEVNFLKKISSIRITRRSELPESRRKPNERDFMCF